MQHHERMILRPFDKSEAITPQVACDIAGVTGETMRQWCAVHGIGRKVAGRWLVSRPALLMLLDGDRAALRAYHSGDRLGPLVAPYFERAARDQQKARAA